MKAGKSVPLQEKAPSFWKRQMAFWEEWQIRLYHRLDGFWLTQNFVWNIRKIYEIMKPASEKIIILSAMQVVEKCFLVGLGLLAFSYFLKGASLYAYFILFSMFFVAMGQVVNGSLWREEYRILSQLEQYLGDVRHYYHIGGMVEEAVYDSMEEAPYEISLHMQKIYDALMSKEEGADERYKEIAPNKFFKAFLALCRITMEYGDTIKEKKSLFLANLNYLRNEIHIEILKKDKIRYTFSGLVFLTVFPVFFLKAIEDFSVSNLPELGKYYHGKYGILTSVVIFLATVFSYSLISSLKEEKRAIKREHCFLKRWVQVPWVKKGLERYFFYYPGKVHSIEKLLRNTGNEMAVGEFLVQKALLFFGAVLVSLSVFANITIVERHNAIWNVEDFKGSTLMSQKEEVEQWKEWISKGADYYKGEKEEGLKEKIKKVLEDSGKASCEEDREILSQEILARVRKYQGSQFHWRYGLASILLGGALCHAPMLLLEIKRFFLKNAMEDEVMQFQTMIVMLMYIPRMNVETILEWMENFSEVFKESILECQELYSFDRERALKELREKEPFPSFTRIVEDIRACDRVGIEAAFDEIAGQRSYFSEKRKQDNEMQISTKGAIGKVAAYMPMTLVIGLYLIVPFVMESLSQLSGYMEQMGIL